MNEYENIAQELAQNGIELKKNVSLAQYSMMKTGGCLKLLVLPRTIDQLATTIRLFNQKKAAYRVVGATSNILFLDNKEYGALIRLSGFGSIKINKENGTLFLGAGVFLPKLARWAAESGIMGFEGLAGIPGTVGGALYTNAGSYGCVISDHLKNVLVIDAKGEIKSYYVDELDYSFRNSRFKNENLGVIIEAEFIIRKGNPEILLSKIEAVSWNRKTYQENHFPNLGSAFATLDIYRDIGRCHYGYKLVLWLVRKLMRFSKRTNNVLLNYATCRYFGLDYHVRIFSDKTMNCIVNRGNTKSADMVDYLEMLRRLTCGKVAQEIEIA
jgi:UDP-N-acetylmuramate dehydrogenase